ncbi:MAG: rod shape-determining protein MreC [Deltaproteobacteria bacterium]|nr:rod shape-determining protein MreC [Deltaproteobacteria bacterium]
MRSERNNISGFFKKHQLIIISIFLALFSLHLALTDKKEVARGYVLKEILSITVTPVQRFALGAQNIVKGVWDGYINLVWVNKENESLNKTILALREENNRLKEDVNLNSRLREILEFKEAMPFKTVAAGIVSYNMERWTRVVTLDKGKDAGIGKDMAVIGPTGVIGKVLDANSHTSRVLLITDLRSNIDILVQRSRIKGVIEGNGTSGLVLKYIRQVDDVKIGDQVLTSGLAGIFPKGLIVGEVSNIEKGTDNFFKHIEVRPSADMQKIEEVLVVTDTGFFEE